MEALRTVFSKSVPDCSFLKLQKEDGVMGMFQQSPDALSVAGCYDHARSAEGRLAAYAGGLLGLADEFGRQSSGLLTSSVIAPDLQNLLGVTTAPSFRPYRCRPP